jgi:integrase
MKRARHKQGSVVFNRRNKTWHYLWCEDGHRRSKLIGSLRDYPTKAAAWRVAEAVRASAQQRVTQVLTLAELAKRYEAEKLPTRSNTARVYRAWLKNHILPYWGNRPVTDVQPREAELWLKQLGLSPKSRSHVRHMLRTLVDFAMWSGIIEVARNPVDLVRVKGTSKRMKQPRSLKVDEFQRLAAQLHEPFRTMARVAVCLGLRVSELLALRWSDVDWLNQTIKIERRIVAQKVDEVKTAGSRRTMPLDTELLQVLKRCKQTTSFSAEYDWIFASPVQLGRLPYTDSGFWLELQRAAKAAGIEPLGTHSFRHTYRSWLDAVGTPIAVQQKMMRHADIRTTLNIYGDVVTDEMEQAHRKVVGLALNGPAN